MRGTYQKDPKDDLKRLKLAKSIKFENQIKYINGLDLIKIRIHTDINDRLTNKEKLYFRAL